MIQLDIFAKSEAKLLHLANIWNFAESIPEIYDALFVSNPHELASLIGQGTTFNDWQFFLADSRIQDYIDKLVYTQAGVVINKLMKDGVRISQADSAKLNAAIKYRDDHKPNFATPTQYIYMHTPMSPQEKEFLND